MPGKRLEKCSTCTRDFSLASNSAASWAMRSCENMGLLVEQRIQVVVLGVVDLSRTLVDLYRHADVLPLEGQCKPGLDLGQHRIAGFLLLRIAAPSSDTHVDVAKAIVVLAVRHGIDLCRIRQHAR